MKNGKKSGVGLLILICVLLSACGQKAGEIENSVPDTEKQSLAVVDAENDTEHLENTDIEQENTVDKDNEGSSSDEPEDVSEENAASGKRIEVALAQKVVIEKKFDTEGRALPAQELQFFDEFIQESGNYGFLLSAYDTPADADLNEVFYNGLGTNQSEITKEEEQAYLKAIGESEIYTDFNKITTEQLNDFLLEKTGLSYDQMNTRLGWTYLPEYDAYYSQHGDTNYRIFNCKEGYTVDEKTFVLRVTPYDFGYEPDGYHVMDQELVLEKNGETYQFKSNRLMMEERLIEEQSFYVDLSPMGNVIFASYAPDQEKVPLADVSFSILKDGWEITRLYGVFNDNIRTAEMFQEIEAISFADYDEDGITDVIMILNYAPVSSGDADSSYSEIRIYKGDYEEYSYGDYYYFQRYQPELSERLTTSLSEKTVRAVLDWLAGSELD